MKCWVCNDKKATRDDGMCDNCGKAYGELTEELQEDINNKKPIEEKESWE